ncbi:MAG: DUF4866 family protein [Lachnospiraceae bacterium]|nr:DUF4866 family protein [Lachnospiraceae bacterium]
MTFLVFNCKRLEHFTKALFNAYTNRDLTALLIALTGNSMFRYCS